MIKIGWLFYKNGEVFLNNIFRGEVRIVSSVNKILLVGYYLVNLGYAVVTISYWQEIDNYIDMINSLSSTLGKIIILLAVLHFNNLWWLTYITKSKIIKS